MAKHPQDNKTMELLPMPAKRGRKPKGDKAMTPAQRMAAYRLRKKMEPKQITDADEFMGWFAEVAADKTPLEFARWIGTDLETAIEFFSCAVACNLKIENSY